MISVRGARGTCGRGARATHNEHGWADARELIDGINQSEGHTLDMEILEEIVQTDEKQRYSFNEDHTLIRANQGCCLPVASV